MREVKNFNFYLFRVTFIDADKDIDIHTDEDINILAGESNCRFALTVCTSLSA